MASYELIFVVDDLDDESVDEIYAGYDAAVTGHVDLTLLTITAEGPTAVEAAKYIAMELANIRGVVVQRCYEDLVTRSVIASRCNATPQAVGQWIRGERRSQNPFPTCYNLVCGGVWLWGEVNHWLQKNGMEHDDIRFPSRGDYTEINKWLEERRVRIALSSVDLTWVSSASTLQSSRPKVRALRSMFRRIIDLNPQPGSSQ